MKKFLYLILSLVFLSSCNFKNGEITSNGGIEITPAENFKDINVTYVLNGGVNSSLNPNIFNNGDHFELINPTKNNYSFINWHLNSNDGEIIYCLDSSLTNDVTLFAEWKFDRATVTCGGFLYEVYQNGSNYEASCSLIEGYHFDEKIFVKSKVEFEGITFSIKTIYLNFYFYDDSILQEVEIEEGIVEAYVGFNFERTEVYKPSKFKYIIFPKTLRIINYNGSTEFYHAPLFLFKSSESDTEFNVLDFENILVRSSKNIFDFTGDFCVDDNLSFAIVNGNSTKFAVLIDAQNVENQFVIPDTIIYKNIIYEVKIIAIDSSFINNVTSVTLPSCIDSILCFSFFNCFELQHIKNSEKVRNLGVGTFYATNLFSPKLNSLVSIPEYCFAESSIKEVELSDRLKSIKQCAFLNSSLLTITIPGSVELIESESIFASESIVIRSGVKFIQSWSLNSPLLLIDEPSKPDLWDEQFFYPPSETFRDIIIWNFKTRIINDHMEYFLLNNNCAILHKYLSSGKEVEIPSIIEYYQHDYTVIGIHDEAFEGCDLKKVTIPVSIQYIGCWAFSECFELADIYYSGSISEWNSIKKGDFWSSFLNCVVHCSDGNVQIEN